MADNQKMVYSTKGHHSVKIECRVVVRLLAAHHLMKLCICTKFYEYIKCLDVKHKPISLMVLKNGAVDTIF